MSLLLNILAQANNDPLDNGISLLQQYGIAAPFVGFAFWVFKKTWERAADAEAEVKRLNEVASEKTLPALFEVTQSMRDMTVLARDLKMRGEIEREVSLRRANPDVPPPA